MEGEGQLKIFFGYARGVGKTYAMLSAAHRARRAGVDVVVGALSPWSRPETRRLLHGLETLPGCEGAFDLDAALKRAPAMIVVDDLAWDNPPSSRHLTRLLDVEELLRAGIDVYATLGPEQLEGLSDIVCGITGQRAGRRVPDSAFDAAAQVELVDIEPAELVQRLQAQGQPPLLTEKLTSLRELALRRTAQRLDRSRSASGAIGGGVLACLTAAPSSAKVIRCAARLAEAFHSPLTALFVESRITQAMGEEAGRRLRANMKLAEDLGARITTLYGEEVANQIAEYAGACGASKLVIGRTNHRSWGRHAPLVDRVMALAPNLDVYVIPDQQPPFRPARRLRLELNQLTPLDLSHTLLAVLGACLVGLVFYHMGLGDASIIPIYLLGVLVATVWTSGWHYGVLASLLSVFSFNFLFTEPRFTLMAYAPGYPLTFAVMLAASFMASSLTQRIKRQARQEARKAYRTEVLLETSQKLQAAQGEHQILEALAAQLNRLLDRPTVIYPCDERGELGQPWIWPAGRQAPPEEWTGARERAAAQWVARNNKHAGAGTGTLPGSRCLYLSVRGSTLSLAVVGVVMQDRPPLDAFEKNLMLAMLDECGFALERERLDHEKRRVESQAQQEALRANLLRAISHDLRTPLTTISGNAAVLMNSAAALSAQKRNALYESIYDDALWLYALVENLLSITRLEEGRMRLSMMPELVVEVVGEALSHLDRHAAEHTIGQKVEDEMLMACMDARLIVQVLVNLVGNAIKYTPPDSSIQVRARAQGAMVRVEVADDGPGVPAEAREHIFDMFYTADNARGDGRRGLGLGLSLCKSIVLAHGGQIGLSENCPHGALFYFTLKKAEVEPYE